jgi:thioesterase domain-containing protein
VELTPSPVARAGDGPSVGSRVGAGAGAGSGAGAASCSGVGVDSVAVSNVSSGAGAISGSGPASGAGAASGSGVGVGAGAVSGASAGAGAISGSGPASGAGAASGSDVGVGAGAGAASGSGAGVGCASGSGLGERAARPFFCVHPAGGNVLCYTDLARALGPGQPLYGLQLPDPEVLGPDPTIEAMAACYVAALAAAAAGPYALGGWSLGGAIAYEMARQLRAAGQEVDLLALIDPSPVRRHAAEAPCLEETRLAAEFAYDLVVLAGRGAAVSAATLQRFDRGLPLPDLVAAAHAAGLLPAELAMDDVERLFALFRTSRLALDRYRPLPSPGPLTLLLARDPTPDPLAAQPAERRHSARSAATWAALAGGGAEVETLPGDHYSIVRPPAVAVLASRLRRRLPSPARHRR